MPDLRFVAIEGDWMGFFEGLCKIQDLVLVYCGGIRCDWRRLDGIGWDWMGFFEGLCKIQDFVLVRCGGFVGIGRIRWDNLGVFGILWDCLRV